MISCPRSKTGQSLSTPIFEDEKKSVLCWDWNRCKIGEQHCVDPNIEVIHDIEKTIRRRQNERKLPESFVGKQQKRNTELDINRKKCRKFHTKRTIPKTGIHRKETNKTRSAVTLPKILSKGSRSEEKIHQTYSK